ncbi:MAG: dicarboxylate/amino acid:cation symporter [Sedimentisphaerales bacterium]|nr:dicarboxylate/amino acid:cation symporter [Sedimentisphaerales bacterium]
MKLKIHTQILIAIVLGLVTGIVLGEKAGELEIVGDLFIRLLKMIIVPLILASIVTGIISLGDTKKLGRIGLKTFLYYLTTTALAVILGLVLVNIIQPGKGVKLPTETTTDFSEREAPSIISILTDIIPENIFAAMAQSQVLSIIFFSILLGIAICSIGEKGKPLVNLFEAFNDVMLKITGWIMRLAPIGIFALMAHTIGTLGLSVLKPLAIYMITVVLGLLIHAVIVLPILLRIFGKYSPLKLIKDVFSAVTTAFSTASSAATLPITMECLQENTGVSKKITSFVLPLGATINMDGTALYEAVAAMFIAQVYGPAYGIHLGFSDQIIIVLTATLASIGAAAIPSAGLITLIIVLRAVNLPIEGIGMILAVDRILDMCRTAVNVWGDTCGTVIVAKLEQETLNN